MDTIPLISTDTTLLDRLSQTLQGRGDVRIAMINHAEDAIDYLNVELPDLVFVNFSDPVNDNFVLLDTILADPWLLHSSIIALCADSGVAERIEKMRSANIVVSLVDDELERFMPRILDIMVKNRRILFQRSLEADFVSTITGSFTLDNNLVEANCHANLVCNYLFNANKINGKGKTHISLALVEMLINAIEHGNCGITYNEKGAWLEEGNAMSGLIDKKCQDPAVRARRVTFEYTIGPAKSRFHIADQGDGFDWRRLQDSANVEELHGRGIKLTRKYTKNLTYNDKGNAVSFEIEHIPDCTNSVPAIFETIEPTTVNVGDVVFNEGEAGNFLYYIARGSYEVVVKGAVVATLSPDDIFMGEMAFLLNNRRIATVRATTPGLLLRISKHDFVEAIKQKPHYALFLSRLLAQRLQRRNFQVADGLA